MNGDTKEIVGAIHELAKEVAVLKERHESMESYIFKDLRPDIEKLCKRVENCMNKSVDERQRDLKWAIALSLTFCSSIVGWMLVLLK